MSRGEVKGLQDLAMAHGGSLSINPQTGLPEAGFLSNLLPMIGGAALTAFTGGAVNPMMASMIMGGITGVASGSLSKGLMAGLGAYGGAGMMGGLMGAGAGTAQAAAGALGVPGAATGAGSQAAMLAAQNAGFGQAGLEALGQSAAVAPGAVPVVGSGFDSALAGAKGLGSEAGRDAFMSNIGGGKGLMKYGMAAAAPVFAAPETTTKQPEIKSNSDPGQQYKYSPGRVEQTPDADPLGRGQAYFNPRYTPITQSESQNIYGYAGGGPVEEMSNANAIGANTGYPMADISKGAYATPYQTPISRNVLSDSADTGVNPMTGQMNFADGGITGQGNLNLQIPLDIGGGGGGGGFGQQGANGYKAAGSAGGLGGGLRSLVENNSASAQPALPSFGNPNPPSSGPAALVGKDDPFFQSPEYKEYRDTYPGFSTHDMYYSPIFGQMNSGSDGARQEKAYRKYKGIADPNMNANQIFSGNLGSNFSGAGLGSGSAGGLGGIFQSMSRFKEGGSVSSYQDGGVATATPMPDQYSYDPLKQMFNKIESMPSDNQPAQPTQGGQSPVMSDAAFAKQQSEGQKNLQAMQDGTMMSRIGDSLSEGLSFMAQNSPTMALINAITSSFSGGTGQGMSTPGLGGFSGGTAGLGFAPGTMGPSHAPGPSGGGGGGGGVGTGSGSGGGAAAMGAAGMSGTASAAAGAARGGLMAAYANGGSHLGDYSDGGRLLKGPGDGVSDSIPAMIGRKQPARLADGEFVVPARIVSELGNGSTEAGARKLYAMMDRVQKARGKTVGKGRVAKNSRAERFLPA
jgi:hypothetical protein